MSRGLNSLIEHDIVIDTAPLLYMLLAYWIEKKGIKRMGKIADVSFTKDRANILFQTLRNKKLFITPQVLSEVSYFAGKETGDIGEFLKV